MAKEHSTISQRSRQSESIKTTLDAPVHSLTDARRKLETAAQHAHRSYADDWAWQLVKSALEGLRKLDEYGGEPDAPLNSP